MPFVFHTQQAVRVDIQIFPLRGSQRDGVDFAGPDVMRLEKLENQLGVEADKQLLFLDPLGKLTAFYLAILNEADCRIMAKMECKNLHSVSRILAALKRLAME